MPATVKVWDPLVRLFHWSLVLTFAATWLTGDDLEDLHIVLGFVVAGLVAFRVAWGFVGPRRARFAGFVTGPGTALAYLSDLLGGRERRYLGHNPLGGLMIVLLLASIAVTCLTGWLYTTDAFWGVEWVEEAHEALANAMLLLIAFHVGGVALASLRHGENLARAMVTGDKRAPAGSDVA